MERFSILMEAEGDKEPTVTDYTEGTDDTGGDDTTDTNTATDYTQEDTEIDPEGPTDDTTTTDDDTDSTDDGTGATDYTADGSPEDGSDNPDGTEGDGAPPEEDPNGLSDDDREKNRVLIDDMINVFHGIEATIEKLGSINRDNIVVNKIISQVAINLRKLNSVIYDYIVFDFSKNKYVKNLYNYNYFMQGFKINVEMLKKIQVFNIN